jgi:uncharacterized surface protein with fasciclin (FAS1) repeats
MKKYFFSLSLIAATTTIMLAACEDSESERQYKDSVALEKLKAENKVAAQQDETSGGVLVGGNKLVKSKNLFDNASASSEHTTFVTAIRAAIFGGILSGSGPFTVFAPTNKAFDKLPKGELEELLKPEKKAELVKFVTYHIMQGAITINDVKDGQQLKTIQGEKLLVIKKEGKVMLKDAKGNIANITIPDVISSNGVIFVIDGVLRP